MAALSLLGGYYTLDRISLEKGGKNVEMGKGYTILQQRIMSFMKCGSISGMKKKSHAVYPFPLSLCVIRLVYGEHMYAN